MEETRTITIVIDRETYDESSELTRTPGRDKQSIAQEALASWLEDQEDIRDARAVLALRSPALSLESVRESLGLAG